MYEQVKGAAMGSPLSPIVANLFMEDLETKALATAPFTPKIWKRFVDDTFTIIQRADKDAFLEHINSISTNIHFTYEDPKEDGSIPFFRYVDHPRWRRQIKTPRSIENQHIQTNTCTGIVITPSHQSIVLLELCITGQEQCAPNNGKWRKTFNQVIKQMQIPKLGIEQNKDQEPNSPEEEQDK